MKSYIFSVTSLDGVTLFTSIGACTPVHAWFAIRDTRRYAASRYAIDLLNTGDYLRNRSAMEAWIQILQEAA